MKVVITSIELKSPFKFFRLSYKAMKILRQLQGTNYVSMKKRGFWMKHYTMTSWKSAEDMRKFVRSGAHLDAMKTAGEIASEIRIASIEANTLPDWKTAKALLENGRISKY